MIHEALTQAKHQIVGHTLKPTAIASLIERLIGEKYGLTFSTYAKQDLEENQATVNAYFDPAELYNPPNIELIFVHHPKKTKGINIDETGWESFAFRIEQAVLHELIHRRQYEKRKIVTNKLPATPIGYLSCPDEIEAHAHDIMLELTHYGYDLDHALQRLKNYPKISAEESITLYSYMLVFENAPSNPTMQKLIRKTVKFLNEKWKD